MKNKLMKSSVITALLYLFAFVPMAFAQTPAYNQYSIESYSPALYTGVGTGVDGISKAFNALAELFFLFTTLIYQMVDYAITLFSDQELIQEFAAEVQNYSEEVFDVLYDSFGLIFFVIFVLSILFTFLFRNTQSAIRQATTLFLVIGLSTAWITHSEEYLKWLDDITDEVAVKIANIGADGSIAENLHQVAFEQMVYEPFLIMNYGTTDEDVINQSVPNRNTSLLYSIEGDSASDEVEEVDEYINNNESENYYMSPERANQQLAIAMVSVLNAILIGIPILLCSMLGFFIEILILLLAFLVPYCAILSLLPKFSNAFFGLVKKIVMLFGGKILVGVVIGGMLGVMRIAEAIVPAENGGTYLLQTAIVFTTFIVVFLFRKQIITIVTDGQITAMPMDKAVDKAERTGKRAVKDIAKGAMAANGVDPVVADKTVDMVADELEDEPEVERNQQTDDLDDNFEKVLDNEENSEGVDYEEDELEQSEDIRRTEQFEEELLDEVESMNGAEETEEAVEDSIMDEVEPMEGAEETEEAVDNSIMDEVESMDGTEEIEEAVDDSIMDEVEPMEGAKEAEREVEDSIMDEVEPMEGAEEIEEAVDDSIMGEVEPKKGVEETEEAVEDSIMGEVELKKGVEEIEEAVDDSIMDEVEPKKGAEETEEAVDDSIMDEASIPELDEVIPDE